MTFFILGRQSTLSVSEISAIIGSDFDYSKCSKEILLLKGVGLPYEELQKRLGGTIKIGKILKKVELSDIPDEIAANIANQNEKTGKIRFGISLYDGGDTTKTANLVKSLHALGLEAKKLLKNSGFSCRYVSSVDRSLSSVIVKTNKLIESGGEFVVIVTENSLLLGKTETVQNFKAWSNRDFGRPARDSRSGMLPPKLARQMINLSGANPVNSSLLDPFCGSGTVLTEAVELGFKSLIGSDISKKAIEDTKKNLEWQEVEHFPLLEVSDAAWLGVNSAVDVIVTETFLGPPQRGRETKEDIIRIEGELIQTYQNSFKNLTDLLKKGGVMTIAFPAFVRGQKIHFLPISKLLKNLNLTIIDPLPKTLPNSLRKITPNGGILYQREKQKVAREIISVKK